MSEERLHIDIEVRKKIRDSLVNMLSDMFLIKEGGTTRYDITETWKARLRPLLDIIWEEDVEEMVQEAIKIHENTWPPTKK